MSRLLLCIGRRGKRPYFPEDGKLAIYSLEELCYYIYHHIYLITMDFFGDKLIAYLKEELSLDFLAGRLETLVKAESSLEDTVMALMSFANYYNKEEIEEFRERVHEFSVLSAEERLKRMGDTYLSQRQYAKALRQYQKLEQMYLKSMLPERFWANAFHNMGLSYLRMLYYQEAADYMIRSYELIPEEQYLKDTALAYYLSGDLNQYQSWKNAYPEAEFDAWEEEWQQKKGDMKDETFCTEAISVLEHYQEGRIAEYQEQVTRLLDRWKQEYRRDMANE